MNTLVAQGSAGFIQTALLWAGHPIYFVFLTLWGTANVLVIRRHLPGQVLSLAIKMATLCVMVQPFIHPSHSRYWPTFGPLMALAATHVIMTAKMRFSAGPPWPMAPLGADRAVAPHVAAVLTGLQAFYALAFVSVAAVLITSGLT